MLDFLKWTKFKKDAPPGTLVYTGRAKDFTPFVNRYSYDAQSLHEDTTDSIETLTFSEDRIDFFHVVGIHRPELIKAAGEMFDIPPLTLEDTMNTGQRSKFEWIDDDTCFVVMRAMDIVNRCLKSEQVSLLWRKGLVVVFSEEESPLLNGVINRLKRKKGKIRNTGSSYLATAIMDAVVDRQLLALAQLSELAEGLESDLMHEMTEDGLDQLYQIKRETILLRNTLMPVRDIFTALLREEAEFPEEAIPYLHDVAGHNTQAVEGSFALHDILKSMIDYQISLIGIRTNRVMQFLTVIATIFIPLTFIAGVYGMNFQYMPELQWRYGYFIALGAMGAVAVIMLFYFFRRKLL